MSFEFSCLEDQLRILCVGNWLIGKYTLTLHKWTSNLDLNNDFLTQATVWITLLKIPLEYQYEDFFDSIANSFEDMFSIDLVTTAKKRLTYARIYVEVVKGQDIPQLIEFQSCLGRKVQQIDYENVPFSQFHYKKVGHKEKACPIFKDKEKV